MEEIISGSAKWSPEGIMIGYTTWGPARGGCGHTHETIAEGVRCLEEDRKAVGSSGIGLCSDRRLQQLVLCPTDDITQHPFTREHHEVLACCEFPW
jgi:hypothetical protein